MGRRDLELGQRQEIADLLREGTTLRANHVEGWMDKGDSVTVHLEGCHHLSRSGEPDVPTVDELIIAVCAEADPEDLAGKLCSSCGAQQTVFELPHLKALHDEIADPLDRERIRAMRAASSRGR